MCPVTSRERSVPTGRRIDHIHARRAARIQLPRLTKLGGSLLAISLVGALLLVAGFLSRNWWMPRAGQLLATAQDRLYAGEGSQDTTIHDHAEADAPAHGTSGEATSLELSEQAQKNVGLELFTVELGDFDRTITVPAMIVERAGRTKLKVSAQMTGIVTRVYPIRGEAVTPGQLLFDVRLTHEDLVATQSAFLETVEKLDVIRQEVVRLEKVTSSGAVAGKRLLERQYERQKTEASFRAQRQALILHGLSEEQVDGISSNRQLLQNLTVVAPPLAHCESCEKHEEYLQVAELMVAPGEHVAAGTQLCTLTDHCVLYVEGRAFEQDAEALNEAADKGVPVTAVVEGNGSGPHEVPELRILYLENQVEVDSRALKFYLSLPNELVRNEATAEGHRFIGWRYRPGQRVELKVPVQRWESRIVLPVDAVIKEGAEWYVFQQNGPYFDRRSVHVEYRDQRWAVIANDGTLFPGDLVAAKGAYQIHLALKNKAGGGVDPHAGHNH